MVNVVPWDLPRHNTHHDTSSAFSNNVPILLWVSLSEMLEDILSSKG